MRNVAMWVMGTAVVACLTGCVSRAAFERLETRLAELNTRVTELEKARPDLQQFSDRLKAAEDEVQVLKTSSARSLGVANELATKLDAQGKQLTAVQDAATEAQKTSIQALGASRKTDEDLQKFAAETKALHAGYLKAIDDMDKAFANRLVGTQREFDAKVDRLETQLKGVTAEVSAKVELQIKDALAKVEEFKTQLLGELARNKEGVEKVRLENQGFGKQLADTMAQMKTMQEGYRAEMKAETDKMAATYNGIATQFDQLKKRVDEYGKQLDRIGRLLAAALTELKAPEAPPKE